MRHRRYNRATILHVMRVLLRRKSLDAISMEEVATEAGLTRRTIYNHFASTTQLFQVSQTMLVAELAPLMPSSVRSDLRAEAALADFAEAASAQFADPRHQDIYLSLVREAPPWLAGAYEQQIFGPMVATLSTYLETTWSSALYDHATIARQFLALLQVTAARTLPYDPVRVNAAERIMPNILVDALVRQFLEPHAIAA